MSWLRTCILVAGQSTALLIRSRMLWLLGIGGILGALFFLVMSARIADEVPGNALLGFLVAGLYVQMVLPFAALYFGVTTVHGDLEDGTVVYLHSRPLSRSAVLIGKWAGAAAVSMVLVACGIVLLYVCLAAPSRDWRSGIGPDPAMLPGFAAAVALGAPAYAALGALCGALLRRPLILGLAFLVGWEGAVSLLAKSGQARATTVSEPLRRLLFDMHAPRGPYREFLAGPFGVPDDLELPSPVWSVIRWTIVVLGAAALIYARREYGARHRE